jgi:uncharacterized repeat protein (TIGR01451 family)
LRLGQLSPLQILLYQALLKRLAHVSGAVAVLSSIYPNESPSQIQGRLTTTGLQITDPKNNITTPRLNLLAAATPMNDMFSNRITLTGSSGSTSGTNLLATKETGEPIIAGNIGGQSLWWKWIAPQSGQLSLNTNGSKFDTLLGVYTGTQISGLNLVASKDNTGSLVSPQADLVLNVTAGTEYEISLDVANGSASSFILNWNLNPATQTILSAAISGALNVKVGDKSIYTLTVSDIGSQTATNITATLNIPAGATVAPISPNCSVLGSLLSCNLSSISAGTSQSFDFQITWITVPTSSVITANISSDSTPSVTQIASGNILIAALTDPQNLDSADIPMLPNWGLIILGIAILLINLRASKR